MKPFSISQPFLIALCVTVVALVCAPPLLADPTKTTEHITTRDGLSGTRTTTVDGNKTTVVDDVSGTQGPGMRPEEKGAYITRTTTTVTTGNPTTSQTVTETETFYEKKDGPLVLTRTDTISNTAYNELGGYTQTVEETQTYAQTGTVEVTTEQNQCDAAGHVQSGTTTTTFKYKNGKEETLTASSEGQSHGVFPHAIKPVAPLPGLGLTTLEQPKPTAEPTTEPTPTPTPAPEAPKHHASALGWILGTLAVVGVLFASGNHGNSASSNGANQPGGGSQLTFTPATESICLNKFANATVKDPSNPSAQFQLISQNTSVVQIGSAMTNGPIDITPFGLGSTNIVATEVGSGKNGMLPVMVTPAC